MKKKSIILVLGLLILSIAVFAYFINKKNNAGSGEVMYFEYKVGTGNIESYIEVDGKIDSDDTKEIYTSSSLRVKEVFFEEGDYVEKGQVILTFDDENRNTVSREIESKKLDLKELYRNKSNSEELFKIGGAAKNDIQDLNTDIRQLQLEIEELREELSKMDTKIVSPFNGTITDMIADENYRVNTEEPLLEISDLTNVIIVAEVPEYEIGLIKEGMPATIKLESREMELKGTVSDISTLANDNSTETEAYINVDIKFDEAVENIGPGFTGKVKIIYEQKNDVLEVPRTSIYEENGKSYVQKLNDNNEVSKVEIKTGSSNKSNLEILSGLNKGERILLIPNTSLKDGTKVKLSDKSELEKMKKKSEEAAKGGQQGGPGGGKP